MEWTDEEIQGYRPNKNILLTILYTAKGISVSEPKERARYLCEDVLDLGMTDTALIMRTASIKGKIEAMSKLEEMAVTYLSKQDNILL